MLSNCTHLELMIKALSMCVLAMYNIDYMVPHLLWWGKLVSILKRLGKHWIKVPNIYMITLRPVGVPFAKAQLKGAVFNLFIKNLVIHMYTVDIFESTQLLSFSVFGAN